MKNNYPIKLFIPLLLIFLNIQQAYAQKDSILLKVYFSEGKFVLSPASKTLLKNFAAEYKDQQHINIAGRGDRHGSDALNDSLSVKRALAVKQFLIANQFPREHIHAIIGYGRRNPVESTPPYVDSNNRVVWITVAAGETLTAGGSKVYIYRDSLVLVPPPYPAHFLSLHPSIKPGDTLLIETRSRQVGDTLRNTRVIYLAGREGSPSKPDIKTISMRDSLIKLLPPYPLAYLAGNKKPLKGDTLHIDTTMNQVNTTLFIARKIYIADDTTQTVLLSRAKEIPEKTKTKEIARAFLDTLQNSAVGQAIIIRKLSFEFGYHVMPTTDLPALEAVSEALKSQPALKLEIRGHVCCGDPKEKDVFDKQTGMYDLSSNRAKEVYDFLVDKGVNKTQITHEGYGMKQPLSYPEKSKNDQYRNRRIEFVIMAK